MTKKAFKLINIIAGLDADTHADLIDDIICTSIENGIDVSDNDIESDEISTAIH